MNEVDALKKENDDMKKKIQELEKTIGELRLKAEEANWMNRTSRDCANNYDLLHGMGQLKLTLPVARTVGLNFESTNLKNYDPFVKFLKNCVQRVNKVSLDMRT